jgi:hypothetical protein
LATANYDAKKIDPRQDQVKTLEAAVATVGKILQTKWLPPEEGDSFKASMPVLTCHQKDASEAINPASSD